MAEIHAAAWIIIGIIVTIVSFALQLTFFQYLGIIFIVWGLGKLSYRRLSKTDAAVSRALSLKPLLYSAPQAPMHHQMRQGHSLRCPHCGTMVKEHDNFCPRCGARRIRV